jgi:hypothetical protein
MELVDIDWRAENGGHLHLKIPRAYLSEMYQEKGESTITSLVIETGLPDLKPRPAVPMRRGDPGSTQWEEDTRFLKDGMRISLTKLGSRIPSEQVQTNYLNSIRGSVADRQAIELASIDGLLRFLQMTCSKPETGYIKPPEDPTPEGCRSTGRETFISPTPGPNWVQMICRHILKGAPGPIPGCQITVQYNSHFFVEFMIRNTEQSRWKKFEIGTRKLIDSFQVKEEIGQGK